MLSGFGHRICAKKPVRFSTMLSGFGHRIWAKTGGKVRNFVKLAERPKSLLTSNNTTHMYPKYVEGYSDDFPHRIDVSGVEKQQLESYSREVRPKLDALLLEYGAVLFRGLPLDTAGDFSKFFLGLGHRPMDYIGGVSLRSKIAPGIVDTGSQLEQKGFFIEPHCEMAYFSNFPHMFCLFAEVPPSPGTGGENGITDMRKVLRQLDPEVVEKFTRLGVRYHRFLPDRTNPNAPHHYSYWQVSLLSETRKEAEQKLEETGHTPDLYKWDEEGSLYFWSTLPAIRPHHRTGEMMWFNQIDLMHWTYFLNQPDVYSVLKDEDPKRYPFTTFYGDGTDIELDVMEHIRATIMRCTRAEQLRRGDVMVLDNMSAAHSKFGFTGERVMRVALAKFAAQK
ncbi:dapdiamide synthesis protein DdaC-like [Lineus longissimus]|uniref:dapdiamide synthesis protein DdaC-like n=1 Tax=Lineus longissimus TaxID=88925 RepID=UPI002B4EB3ED